MTKCIIYVEAAVQGSLTEHCGALFYCVGVAIFTYLAPEASTLRKAQAVVLGGPSATLKPDDRVGLASPVPRMDGVFRPGPLDHPSFCYSNWVKQGGM